jgi:predicted RecB family endonuclease
MPVSARPGVDSDSPNVPIAAEDVPTRLNIQVVAGDLALAAVRVDNVNSMIVGTNIDNGYLAERVGQ